MIQFALIFYPGCELLWFSRGAWGSTYSQICQYFVSANRIEKPGEFFASWSRALLSVLLMFSNVVRHGMNCQLLAAGCGRTLAALVLSPQGDSSYQGVDEFLVQRSKTRLSWTIVFFRSAWCAFKLWVVSNGAFPVLCAFTYITFYVVVGCFLSFLYKLPVCFQHIMQQLYWV